MLFFSPQPLLRLLLLRALRPPCLTGARAPGCGTGGWQPHAHRAFRHGGNLGGKPRTAAPGRPCAAARCRLCAGALRGGGFPWLFGHDLDLLRSAYGYEDRRTITAYETPSVGRIACVLHHGGAGSAGYSEGCER